MAADLEAPAPDVRVDGVGFIRAVRETPQSRKIPTMSESSPRLRQPAAM